MSHAQDSFDDEDFSTINPFSTSSLRSGHMQQRNNESPLDSSKNQPALPDPPPAPARSVLPSDLYKPIPLASLQDSTAQLSLHVARDFRTDDALSKSGKSGTQRTHLTIGDFSPQSAFTIARETRGRLSQRKSHVSDDRTLADLGSSASNAFGRKSAPLAGGYLEIEEEQPDAAAAHDRRAPSIATASPGGDEDLLGLDCEPVRTDSGLLLTHRRSLPGLARTRPPRRRPLGRNGADRKNLDPPFHGQRATLEATNDFAVDVDVNKKKTPRPSFFLRVPSFRPPHEGRNGGSSNGAVFGRNGGEIDGTWSARSSYGTTASFTPASGDGGMRQRHARPMHGWTDQKRLLSCARVWIALLCAGFVVGTGVAAIAVRHERRAGAAPVAREGVAPEGSDAGGSDPATLVSTPAKTAPTPVDGSSSRGDVPASDGVGAILVNATRLTLTRPTGAIGEAEDQEDDQRHRQHHHSLRRTLQLLRAEFDEWVEEHRREYGSREEREKRFKVWTDNHHRTEEKNRRHGPCKLTKKKVFGSNHFKDLTPEEFQARYLTGYNGPTADKFEEGKSVGTTADARRRGPGQAKQTAGDARRNLDGSGFVPRASDGGDPRTAVERHPSVQKQYVDHFDKFEDSTLQKTYTDNWTEAKKERCGKSHGKTCVKRERGKSNGDSGTTSSSTTTSGNSNNHFRTRRLYQSAWSSTGCAWYNVSCWLRWFFNSYAYGIGGTMEPDYDADSYPSAVDWREFGAVTDVHSQGNCGACWAITAVETIESAYFIKTGTLIDLAETEVIVCDDTCEMCNGGWPQNAYEYVMENDGLPTESDLQYDGDWLLALSSVKAGESDEIDWATIEEYEATTCPSGGGNSGSGSGDGNNYQYNEVARYGKIGGYGYACDRCLCYTDGTGCDCDEQNEALAVRNVATYGPATVCLEASLWQDYAGGIITSDSGCSSDFLDMNHCVQAVGYAFGSPDEEEGAEDEEWDQNGSGSGSGSGSKGSQDDTERVGYWIIRNQWSSNWGMNGYAYLAMGENTCGVLNDMTQAYG